MSFARHTLAPLPSMSAALRSTCVVAMTSSAQWDCICCGKVGSKPNESPDPTNRQTPRCGGETYASRPNSSDHCPGRLLTGEFPDTAIGRLSTTPSCSHPKNHCIRDSQRSTSASRCPASIHRTEPAWIPVAGHGRAPGERCLQNRSAFFPPIEYSPNFTFVFVSTEISSVSGSDSALARTDLTFSKIASVSFVFLRGFPF